MINQGTLAANSNYTISFNRGTLTITPAPLSVNANPLTKVYGTSDPSLTDAATGFVDTTVDGVTINDTAATAPLGPACADTRRDGIRRPLCDQPGHAGRQWQLHDQLHWRYTDDYPGAALRYRQSANQGLWHQRSSLDRRGDGPCGYDRGWDDNRRQPRGGAHRRACARTAGETVSGGPYAINQGTLTANSSYTINFTGSTLAITRAALAVAANPQTKVYGTADPSLTDTATGFVDATVDGVTIDDTAATALSGQLARTPGETVSGGPYAITQGTLTASNYRIAFTGNRLAITPATLLIVAEPETKVFGSADPTLAYTTSSFQFSDTAATVLTGSPARAAGEAVSGSPYMIGQGTLTANSNYMIQFSGSTLTVSPATPPVTVSDPGGTYTSAPIAATATVAGVGGTVTPELEGVKPALTYYIGSGTSGMDLGSAAPAAAGTYTVVARFAGSPDYAAAQSEPVTFVIAPAAATIILTSPSSSPVFGQAVTFVVSVSSAGGTPGGTVTFADGTMALATVPLNGSGQAAVTISTLSLGSQMITATYNGDSDSLGVKSGAAAEIVSPAANRDCSGAARGAQGEPDVEGGRPHGGDRAGGSRRGRADRRGDLRVREEAREEGQADEARRCRAERRCGDADVQAGQGAESTADDRVQRRSRLPGEHDEPTQIDQVRARKCPDVIGQSHPRCPGPICCDLQGPESEPGNPRCPAGVWDGSRPRSGGRLHRRGAPG